MRYRLEFIVNGRRTEVEVRPYETLVRVLRERLGLYGTKNSCDYGGCGACTVIVDGKSILSCMYPAAKLGGTSVLTIEGLERDGQLDPIQESFIRNSALQCGYCIPGMIMSAKALLDANASPSDEDIREALAGNVCRCTGYVKILNAVREAADALRAQLGTPSR